MYLIVYKIAKDPLLHGRLLTKSRIFPFQNFRFSAIIKKDPINVGHIIN